MSGQTTVASIWRGEGDRRPKGWKTFLHNHADGIASMDLFVVPDNLIPTALRVADTCITIAAKSCGWE